MYWVGEAGLSGGSMMPVIPSIPLRPISNSFSSVFTMFWLDKKRKGSLHQHLRRKGRRYRKLGSSKDSRGKIIGSVGIENRPKEPEERKVFGHLEVDTIIGKNH